ncbi:BglG family transcription antiterminator LicT [Streptococcus pyogenes]|uniref:BglG family transcription antiterminator LicT n=1 Tax=Streptococcus pyogenes TaxID=1314 RepID=UPI000DA3DF79|nr:PRD domain-containing protein [Streptococcus pyogenes]SQG24039.1 Cryptic beta-glucoside bgl operon antiterminator [Streptococcus pyogenes]
MLIKRVLNHNAAISTNHQGLDILLMGKGIAFGKKVGDSIELNAIETSFVLKNSDNMNRFTELFITVPQEVVACSERIINLGKIKLGKTLDEILYINLTDHIHSAIERHEQGMLIHNPLRWEIQRYYPDEYSLGVKALELIERNLGVTLAIDEAAFIAMHFVNASLDTPFKEPHRLTEIVSYIEQKIKTDFKTELDDTSIDYYRFMTHIKLFAQRVLSEMSYDDDDAELLIVVKTKYPKEYRCVLDISEEIKKRYNYHPNSSELLYLTVHVKRLVKHLKET